MNVLRTPLAELDFATELGRLFALSSVGRALQFDRAVEAAITRVLADPASFATHHAAPHLRRCPIGDGFAHDVLFRTEGNDLFITAIWHPHRDPADLARR
ncbi:type II toxin-antitoxin system RelE/ParE family toxin [Alienimonas chondri]|uniref:Type II toxin-antitoxin system RelE/ParE family toxin n=1 Tax=Alienimonas chondri TaxID=2681879 RepID=A0ABX1VJ71_9PLAN|nr:hypothetical protein [Alienimonas chondri]NNJ28135.1 hypothetical protein [Alienimonas chondri]